jgi:hypothetical protein
VAVERLLSHQGQQILLLRFGPVVVVVLQEVVQTTRGMVVVEVVLILD